MARRSPTNNRYQKGTTPKGVTRKSAASAKPKRRAGDAVNSKKAATTKGAKSNKSSWLRDIPDTPEYKKYRKLWWYSLGAAVVLVAISISLSWSPALRETLGLSFEVAQPIANYVSMAALVVMAFSWWVDLKKIRPLMKGTASKSDKTADEKKQEKEVKKQAKEAKAQENLTKKAEQSDGKQENQNQDSERSDEVSS